MIKITLLYFDGCPSWKTGLENLRTALDAEQIRAEVKLVQIHDPEQAEREQFLGSPSFKVNGVDLWPEARDAYGLSCRIYATPGGLSGAPTVEMLRERLRKIAEARDGSRG